MARPVSARLIALDVLDRVLGEARPLEETFVGHPALALLDPRDRAFSRLLAATVLRRLGQIDALLDRLMRSRPKAVRVHNLLRLGAAQLLFLETPAHAAVAETVALASGPHDYAKGLVNAVLRRLAREGTEAAGGPGRRPPQHAGLALGKLESRRTASRRACRGRGLISPSRRLISP